MLTVLAYLGWKTYPVARLGRDVAGERVVADMKRWGVRTDFISQEEPDATPVILERIRQREGAAPRHSFDPRCPHCGHWFPRFKPFTLQSSERVLRELPATQVFYFDRAFPGSLQLAAAYKAGGALVFFEPNSVRDEALFSRAVNLSHILKYSAEKFGSLEGLVDEESIPLHVETQGEDGLRFRMNGDEWVGIPAAKAPVLRDSAGAGDWSSAGLIHYLFLDRNRGFSLDFERVERGLRFGQSMAALNCAFEGARGAMYGVTKPQFQQSVLEILSTTQGAALPKTRRQARSMKAPNSNLCQACGWINTDEVSMWMGGGKH